MPANWSWVRTAVSALVGDVGNIAFPTATVDNAIGHAIKELSRQRPLCQEIGDIATVAGAEEYILNSTAPGGGFVGQPLTAIRVLLQRNTYDWISLRESSARTVNVYPVQGIPEEYNLEPWVDDADGIGTPGARISFHYVPNAIYMVRIWATTLAPATTSTVLSIPAECEDWVIARSAEILRMPEGNLDLAADFAEEMAGQTLLIRSCLPGTRPGGLER